MKFFATIRNVLRHIFRRSGPSYYLPSYYSLKDQLPPSVARSVGHGDAIGRGLADGLKTPAPDGMRASFSIIDEMHEMKLAPLVTSVKPNTTVVTFRADGIDAFCAALRRIGVAAAEAAAALGVAVRAVTDADLINRYGTAKEIHYITHGRKARTRKKYRNRVLRRAHRAERRNAREKRTPRA